MLEFNTKLHDGKLPEDVQHRIREYFKRLGESPVHIYIDKKRKARSKPQRGYYWGCVLPEIFNFCQGTEFEFETVDDIHEFMKAKFLTIVPTREDGTLMEKKTLSTESLTAKETEEYYEQIRRFWAMQGLYIPLPNEFQSVDLQLI